MDTSLKIQMDIKNNAQELQSYMLDMNNWEEEMKRKEIALNNEKPQQNSIPPPRNKIMRNKANKTHPNKPKRISAYDYSSWDKFDVEKACAEVDEESDHMENEGLQESNSDHEEEGKGDATNKVKNLSLIDEAFYEKEMGNQFVKQGKWANAIKCYTNAINLCSNNAIYYANRSLCFLKLKNFKSAETDATTAIQLDENYVKAYQRRALARLALKQLQEAKSDYLQILTIEPKNALARAEIIKIDELLKKEQEITESVKNTTFEYKNIFKNEEIKKDKQEKKDVLVKKKRTSPENTNSLKSQKLSPVESRKTDNGDNRYKKDYSGSFTNLKKNMNLENKSHCVEKGDGDKRVVVQSGTEIFKPFPEGCKIIHPVQLPPHKRTKKLLRRIVITEKEEVIDFADDKTMHIIPYDRIEGVKVSQKPDSEDELRSEISFEKPKTAIQFQNCWKIIKKNPEKCYSYLKKIPGRELVHIFENSLESSFFSDLITFLASDSVKKEAEVVYDFLIGLSKVRRFRSLILFMSEVDRTCVKKCICDLEKVYSKEEISELLILYELKV